MLIVRSPLRITLGGGGTDLPSYYRKYGGFAISAAIDKYVYITIHEAFSPEFILKYSRLERVDSVEKVEHPIIRECLKAVGATNPGIEITSLADIPAGTGLGSSGSFTTALLKALHVRNKHIIDTGRLADEACEIEIEKVGASVGKQDQYISAFGGLRCLEFRRDDSVATWTLKISQETLYNLEDNLLLFFTGYSRSASSILKDQDDRSKLGDRGMLENLHFVKELGTQSQAALEDGDLEEFARLMDVHWQHKKRRSKAMTNDRINEWYELAMANGARGGKLIGAGGGGFLIFYAEDKQRLRRALAPTGLAEVRFRFDFEGTKVVVQ